MSSNPSLPSLLSLNEDVLSEILRFLLLDTPRDPYRAAILRTCSLLYDLGLPFLYEVIDLRGFSTKEVVIGRWKGLFGEGGVLTGGGRRGEELARSVVELRMGGGEEEEEASDDPDTLGPSVLNFDPQRLNLPNCSLLLFDVSHDLNALDYPPLFSIISQLPLTNLIIHDSFNAFTRELTHLDSSLSLGSSILGHDSDGPVRRCPPRWHLQEIVFQGSIFVDDGYSHHIQYDWYTLSLSNWSFKSLVLEIAPTGTVDRPGLLFGLFFDSKEDGGRGFLKHTERIEFRLRGKYAEVFEEGFREEGMKWLGKEDGRRNASERKLFAKIVFVGEDGMERRLDEELGYTSRVEGSFVGLSI